MRRLALAVALVALAACSEGGDPVQMALRDAAAARQAAAVKETATVAPPAPAVGTRASAGDADAAYVAHAIEHHRAAMALAVEALARSDDPKIRQLAQAEIDSRARDIAALQAWTPVGSGPVSVR